RDGTRGLQVVQGAGGPAAQADRTPPGGGRGGRGQPDGVVIDLDDVIGRARCQTADGTGCLAQVADLVDDGVTGNKGVGRDGDGAVGSVDGRGRVEGLIQGHALFRRDRRVHVVDDGVAGVEAAVAGQVQDVVDAVHDGGAGGVEGDRGADESESVHRG